MSSAHIPVDTQHIIYLTSPGVLLIGLLVNQPTKLAQHIGSEQGASGPDSYHEIRLADICPFDWQRPQPSLDIQIGHAVSTPVIAHNNNFETLTL